MMRSRALLSLHVVLAAALAACGGGSEKGSGGSAAGDPHTDPNDGPAAGNPNGHADVPAEAEAEDTSHPDRVIGDGSKESCTSHAVVDAIAKGGVITFDCGP